MNNRILPLRFASRNDIEAIFRGPYWAIAGVKVFIVGQKPRSGFHSGSCNPDVVSGKGLPFFAQIRYKKTPALANSY
jgi:hypothetical protein